MVYIVSIELQTFSNKKDADVLQDILKTAGIENTRIDEEE